MNIRLGSAASTSCWPSNNRPTPISATNCPATYCVHLNGHKLVPYLSAGLGLNRRLRSTGYNLYRQQRYTCCGDAPPGLSLTTGLGSIDASKQADLLISLPLVTVQQQQLPPEVNGTSQVTQSTAQLAQAASSVSVGAADHSVPNVAEPTLTGSAVAAAAALQSQQSDKAVTQAQQQQQQRTGLKAKLAAVPWLKLWALALLSVSYVHQATTGFAVPAMLPMISTELNLSDLQGALLTTGYSYLYAVALVPLGVLADKCSRPKLLAGGLAVWSALTVVASTCRSFSELMFARIGFAAAQGVQNPICFSLIPELFPATKSTALAVYNCAIYVGRALSFAAVLLARHLHDNDQAHLAARGGARVDVSLDHLDKADLHSLSIMHSKGDMAAAAPDLEFNFKPWEYGSEWWELPDSSWRQVLRWIALPGLAIALAAAFLPEPRHTSAAAPSPPTKELVAQRTTTSPTQLPNADTASSPASAGALKLESVSAPSLTSPVSAEAQAVDKSTAAAVAAATQQPATAAASTSQQQDAEPSGIVALLRSKGFMSVTLAAALNDVGSYALIAWQSMFYERVYHLDSSYYAPILAVLLPIGGIIGGVGGGFLADRLAQHGKRVWVTGGATMMAAPFLLASCMTPSATMSFATLLVGFALSEAWRAPSAVMARGIAPASMGSTASALYLCVRNLVGGIGPLAVAVLAAKFGLQRAMIVVPGVYLASGMMFCLAERLYAEELRAKEKQRLNESSAGTGTSTNAPEAEAGAAPSAGGEAVPAPAMVPVSAAA